MDGEGRAQSRAGAVCRNTPGMVSDDLAHQGQADAQAPPRVTRRHMVVLVAQVENALEAPLRQAEAVVLDGHNRLHALQRHCCG